MRILILGKYGQLGWELNRALLPFGQIMALDYPEVDLRFPDRLLPYLDTFQPQIICNASAYTAVDRAESELDLAMAVNASTPSILAEYAVRQNAALVHFSTDYVFGGTKGSPYVESDTPNPLNVYGKSKLEGEKAIHRSGCAYLVLRTSWVYSLRRQSFVTKVLQWARQNPSLKIVSDQIGNPTWARMLAQVTTGLILKAGTQAVSWINERKGIYHLAGDGYTSRLDWAQAILNLDPKKSEHLTKNVLPALTAEFPSPAQRPLFSALNCDRFMHTFGLRLPHWRQALRLALQSEETEKDEHPHRNPIQ